MDMDVSPVIDPLVQVTPGAAEEIRSLLQKPENQGKAFRVYIEQGGCSGMQYSMTFDELRPDDMSGQAHGVTVLVDPFSARYLRGAVVDFSDSLTSGGFKITNPNARQSCGCGKSFTA
jgi:iron-sulfur cluster assembly accessory protein